MNYLEQRGVRAKKAATELNRYLEGKKNDALRACAKALLDHETQILSANEKDVAAAKERGVKSSLIDRLSLNHQRLQSMADGLLEICTLADPIGEVIYEGTSQWTEYRTESIPWVSSESFTNPDQM